jgi:hypothetical protein
MIKRFAGSAFAANRPDGKTNGKTGRDVKLVHVSEEAPRRGIL